jgi:hypothetical protein
MSEEEHPLLTKRAQGVVAILALATGLGIALMSFHLLVPGTLLALAGVGAAVWIYLDDFRRLRLRSVCEDGALVKPSAEMFVIIAMLVVAILVPSVIFLHESVPGWFKGETRASDFAQPQARRLSDEQKKRLRKGMTVGVDEHYEIQINSAPSCEECELFAEEVRAYVNTIPGWAASGGPLIFPAPKLRGLKLITRDDEKSSPIVQKIEKTFGDAGMPLVRSSEDAPRGTIIVLVARADS